MHTTLCETFRSLAFRTFDQMSRARHVDHQPLEETFTDINILELKDRHPTEIYCKTFTKPQEGVNGADWEWWLTDASESKWLGLRIQAKVLHLDSNKFSHLHYKSGKQKKRYQANKLKRESAKNGLIPLYCFYLHDQSISVNSGRLCGSYGHAPEAYGCSLAPLAHVESLRKNGEANDLKSVLQGAYPWHCLVCCSGYTHGGTLPERAWGFLTSGMGVAVPRKRARSSASVVHPTVGIRAEPPPYVRAIAAGQHPDNAPMSTLGVVVIKEADSS